MTLEIAHRVSGDNDGYPKGVEAIARPRGSRPLLRPLRAKEARDVVLEPYGLLYGQRPYLIAKQAGKPAVRHYRLQGLANIQLTDEAFARDADFDLAQYGRRLFGVFNEKPFDVCWRFKPEAADDAAEYVFHPDQVTERLEDGSLIVRFKAAGALEMAWHLLIWGDMVKVLEPKDFWTRVGFKNSYATGGQHLE